MKLEIYLYIFPFHYVGANQSQFELSLAQLSPSLFLDYSCYSFGILNTVVIRKYVLSISGVEEVILVTTTLITLGTCCLNTMVFVRQPRALYVGRS